MRIWGFGGAIVLSISGLWPTQVVAQTLTAPELTDSAAMSEGDRNNLNQPATAYLLGPGDQIQVNVFEQAEVTGPHIIAPDGQIALPIVGGIQAAGQTTASLTLTIEQRLLRYYRHPIVSVTISQFRPLRIHVGGEVRRPGPLQMRHTAYDSNRTSSSSSSSGGDSSNPNLPTLSAAIAAAGGVTRDGDISQIALKRNGVVQRIDLWQGLTSENAPRDLLLRDGDAIFISQRPANSPIDPRLVAKSTLAPATVRIRVVGEVRNPGEVSVTPSSTISSAIAIAGGPTDKARMEQVRLLRLGDNDQVIEQTLNLQKLQDRQQVLDGDVVVIPKSRNSKFLDLAGQVIPPLGILLNLFGKQN
jgi:polysaccharide biosynthesis/export protein